MSLDDDAGFLGSRNHVGSITNHIRGGPTQPEVHRMEELGPASKKILKTVTLEQSREW